MLLDLTNTRDNTYKFYQCIRMQQVVQVLVLHVEILQNMQMNFERLDHVKLGHALGQV